MASSRSKICSLSDIYYNEKLSNILLQCNRHSFQQGKHISPPTSCRKELLDLNFLIAETIVIQSLLVSVNLLFNIISHFGFKTVSGNLLCFSISKFWLIVPNFPSFLKHEFDDTTEIKDKNARSNSELAVYFSNLPWNMCPPFPRTRPSPKSQILAVFLGDSLAYRVKVTRFCCSSTQQLVSLLFQLIVSRKHYTVVTQNNEPTMIKNTVKEC